MTENEVAKIIVDAAFTVHTRLGPGLLESVYEAIMEYELRKRGLHVVHQQPIPVIYEDVRMKIGFRPDLIVEGKVIVEVKSLEVLAPVHKKQLLTYLRLADKRLGLLITSAGRLLRMASAELLTGCQNDADCIVITQRCKGAKTQSDHAKMQRGKDA